MIKTYNILINSRERDGYIEGLDGNLRFKYKPMNGVEAYEAEATLQKHTGKDAAFTIAGILTERITSWDIKDDAGEELPIKGNLTNLPFPILNRLYNILIGIAPNDADPNKKPEEIKPESSESDRLIKLGKGEEPAK